MSTLKIKDVMTKRVSKIKPRETLIFAANQMLTERTGLLAVVDERGIAKGVLTDRDVVIRAVASGMNMASTRVSDIMSTDVVSICEESEIGEAVAWLTKHKIGRLLVNDKDGALVGVIARDEATDLAEGELLAGRLLTLSKSRLRPGLLGSGIALGKISRRLRLNPDEEHVKVAQ